MKKYVIIILSIILITILSGIFYIHSKNNNLILENSNINTSENILKIKDYNVFSGVNISITDLEHINNIYYKKINNYEEYITYKNICPGILNMKPEEFEENFMLVTFIENVSVSNLVPYKIETENNTLYLGMIKNLEKNKDSNQTSIILPKKANLENTIIYQCIDFSFPTDKYNEIAAVPKEYDLEQAKKDQCFVVNYDGTIYNQEIFNSFLNAINNKENFYIRMLKYTNETKKIITDIYYSSIDNVYYICQDASEVFENVSYNYYKYTSLEKRIYTNLPNSKPIYYLADDNQEDFILYTY